MKRLSIISILISLVALLGATTSAWAQATSGTWNTMTISGTQTVNLTGTVKIEGTITIPSGASLTINGNGKTIYVAKGGSGKVGTTPAEAGTVSFNVTGGTLVINNANMEGGFDGLFTPGNVGEGGESVFEQAYLYGKDTNNDAKSSKSIQISGNGSNVTLTDVNVSKLYHHYNGIGGHGSFIHATNTKTTATGERNSITLTNVKVENCLSSNESIFLVTGSNPTALYDVTMTSTTFSNCMVTNSYAGIVKGSGKTDCELRMTGCTMENCWGSGWGGAILWAANAGDCYAEFNECTFQNNYARYLGGAISTEAVIYLKDCTLKNNTAGYGGGAVAAFPFTLEDAEEGGSTTQAVGLNLISGNIITGNKTLYVTNKGCTTSGNAMYGVYAESAIYKDGNGNEQVKENEIDTGFNPRYTIGNATDIYYPSGGGAIWILMNKDKWNCSIDIAESNYIGQNKAGGGNTSAYDGGGVFIYKQRPYQIVKSETTNVNKAEFQDDYTSGSGQTSLTLNADIIKNTATHSGGGVAVGADTQLSVFPSVTVNGGLISNNTAQNGNGGGIYMPGGDFTMNGGNVTYNNAVGNGGGISVSNGKFTIAQNSNSNISYNTASRYGGGLYVYNDTSNQQTVSFSGGTFDNNEALAGGGAAVEGEVALTVTNTNLQNNKAKNGGGIYLNNGAEMTYTSGLIRNNIATSATGDTGATGVKKVDTGYQLSASQIEGFGGGVFLDSSTELVLGGTATTPLGLYGNQAYNGADDIFANGKNTSVVLPQVTGMKLEDFRVPVDDAHLYWVKDYVTNDTKYNLAPLGTDGAKDEVLSSPLSNSRYRYSLSNLESGAYYKLDHGTYTGYVSVALGYEVIYVTVKKIGLVGDESAVIKISKIEEGTATPYMTFIMSAMNSENNSETNTLSKKLALPAGTWRVEEISSWSWAYDIKDGVSSYEREITQSTTDKTFTFTNEERDDAPKLRYEAVKVNIFQL